MRDIKIFTRVPILTLQAYVAPLSGSPGYEAREPMRLLIVSINFLKSTGLEK